MAKEYQVAEKVRRSREHNDALSWKERTALPQRFDSETACQDGVDNEGDEQVTKSLFEPGSHVWLYMERVKPGLTKKPAHR
ncbi:hypothetical protein PPTG_22590 [Phytophthora nicotianae INRA-310]|uniref:Uncharacterized protein n=1 Tax=Phytophthora nicotianae (strain INRA-310) TaxID=761204 RepID=W2QE78_PHYN3|nr:hypothetical protein PPTG_22590 [Phytophthora nicotianae INRA-310]ETN11498.1 hypothetical protein PPTG_22590 [Phytophthora nicotianae INRA-310]